MVAGHHIIPSHVHPFHAGVIVTSMSSERRRLAADTLAWSIIKRTKGTGGAVDDVGATSKMVAFAASALTRMVRFAATL